MERKIMVVHSDSLLISDPIKNPTASSELWYSMRSTAMILCSHKCFHSYVPIEIDSAQLCANMANPKAIASYHSSINPIDMPSSIACIDNANTRLKGLLLILQHQFLGFYSSFISLPPSIEESCWASLSWCNSCCGTVISFISHSWSKCSKSCECPPEHDHNTIQSKIKKKAYENTAIA